MTIDGSKVLDYDKAQQKAFQLLREGDKFGFLILCGINMGLRISDLLGVNYDQLKSGEFIVGEKKTGKKRVIVVNRHVKKGLEYMAELDPVRYELGGSPFMTRQYTIWSVQYINRKMKKLFGAGYSSHGMRKCFGKKVYEVHDKDLSIVQMHLNHGDPKHTIRYIGVTQETMNNTFNMF